MFERELELIGAGALGGLLKRKAKHAHQLGTPCANCQAELQGPYCHICGQPSDDQHRSILHLIWEGIEGLTHLDGRLGQTLPPLLIAPGKLARDHFEGRRQRHVPPFRLFLICLLIFMFALESLFHGGKAEDTQVKVVSPKDAGAIVQQKLSEKFKNKAVTLTTADTPAGKVNIGVGPPPANGKLVDVHVDGDDAAAKGGDGHGVDAAFDALHKSRDQAAASAAAEGDKDVAQTIADKANTEKESKVEGWLKPRLKRALDNKEFYLMKLFEWGHRLAILLLPILAGLLALVYIRRRKFFIYDHLIVSMQFLSFVFLISAVAWIMPEPVRNWAILVATIWTPINLYQTLRGAYGSKWYTAAIKTVFLWSSTLFLFMFLMMGLMMIALAEMA